MPKFPPPFRCVKKKCGLYFDDIRALMMHYAEAHTKLPTPRKPRKFSLEDEPLPKPTAEQSKEIRAFIEDGKKRQWQKKHQSDNQA